MRRTEEPIEPIRKTRDLPIGAERAFSLYTSDIGTWWPLASHSIAGDEVAAVRFEERVGGRVVEIATDGAEYVWADVIAWDPPHRLVLAWHPNPEPIAASIVEVRFEPTSTGSRISIDHRGWEEFGDDGPALREQYDTGWDLVLEPLLAAAEAG